MTLELLIDQPGLPGMCPISDAVEKLAHASEAGERGAIFTRREVVDFMLDLAGYTPECPLHHLRLLEPSFGGGEFVLAAVERLISAFRASGGSSDLKDCIRAVELHRNTFETTREKLRDLLSRSGFGARETERLTSAWLFQGDFLLAPLDGPFDFVIGNPPYVRQEL
ncbi:MAG: SAM-dependent DNA methyltransferase, partial [Burkholderiales bacterium]|nr:SAM-dependent DNA methyltransferase [Burkholderiales bacterium]